MVKVSRKSVGSQSMDKTRQRRDHPQGGKDKGAGKQTTEKGQTPGTKQTQLAEATQDKGQWLAKQGKGPRRGTIHLHR